MFIGAAALYGVTVGLLALEPHRQTLGSVMVGALMREEARRIAANIAKAAGAIAERVAREARDWHPRLDLLS